MKLGVIGTGTITKAIVQGLMASDFPVTSIALSRRSQSVSAALDQAFDRVWISDSNQEIVDASDVVILAVLPQQAKAVLSSLVFRPAQHVISVIATVPHERLSEWIGTDVEITRAIPLPAVARRAGVTVIYPKTDVASGLFGAIGNVLSAETVDELDAYATASALMGVYFHVMETAADWLQTQGVAPADAQAYLTSLFLELATTAQRAAGDTLADLRRDHCTPGGLNQQMVDVFTREYGANALVGAMNDVAARIRDMRQ